MQSYVDRDYFDTDSHKKYVLYKDLRCLERNSLMTKLNQSRLKFFSLLYKFKGMTYVIRKEF